MDSFVHQLNSIRTFIKRRIGSMICYNIVARTDNPSAFTNHNTARGSLSSRFLRQHRTAHRNDERKICNLQNNNVHEDNAAFCSAQGGDVDTQRSLARLLSLRNKYGTINMRYFTGGRNFAYFTNFFPLETRSHSIHAG